MAGYALRYYKDFGVQDAIVRVEIHKLYAAVEFAPAPIEIGGVLTALNLHLQGDQGDVTDPIVKTSLEMSLVDAPGSEYGRFTGPYEEFYTPNSTEYLFKVFIDGVQEWSGYLTPDSFEEDITAYGVVTITARDNIGHLQDFMFEENGNSAGMISVMEIMQKAWQLIESPMKLTIPEDGDVVWPECYGYRPYEIMLNVEAFADKNWYEVIEAVLDSFGLVLRYVGKNECVVYPLRSMPLLGGSDFNKVEVKPTLFQASGHRTLQRACKKIVDSLKFDINKEVLTNNVKKADFIGIESSYKCVIDGYPYSRLEHDAPIWPINGKINGWDSASNSLAFDPSRYDIGYFLKRSDDEVSVIGDKIMYIAANNVDDRYMEYSQQVLCRPISINIEFAEPIGITNAGALEKYYSSSLRLRKIVYQLFISDESGIKYWSNGSWKNETSDIIVTYDTNANITQFSADIDFRDIEASSVLLTFRIKKIEYYAVGYLGTADIGIYARLLKMVFKVPDNVGMEEGMTVNSIYDERYNNLIERKPVLGASKQNYAIPKVIQNGLFLPEKGYPSATPWNWPGEDLKTELQVMIAQQILLYNSKPNNLLTGTLLDEVQLLRMPSLWDYNGKSHMLISGSLNLLTGYLEDVKLREYVRWPELYPDDFYLMTEDDQNVMTEDNNKVVISAREYRFLMESGDEFRTEDNNYINMN